MDKYDFIQVSPDVQKAKSIMKMAETTINMINALDEDKFPSNIIKEYYDVIRELSTALILLDGYKTFGEGSHKKLIEYINEKYKEFNSSDIFFLENLRVLRNRIAYDGFFVQKDYLVRNKPSIIKLVDKLKSITTTRIIELKK